jgi:transcriptional regulator with XRE-family HTH domain
MKTAERNEARRLRKEEGRSVKELAALLGVSRSSISLWVRDIELTEDQYMALRRRMGGRIDGSRVNAVKGLERRRASQLAGRERARSKDFLHAAGCMLYWA